MKLDQPEPFIFSSLFPSCENTVAQHSTFQPEHIVGIWPLRGLGFPAFSSVKAKLTANVFDNGFIITQQLVALYAPKGDAEFMRLTREYYIIRYDDFNSITSYLTQIKTLEERIRNTNVTLDDDKRTLLCLGMSLPEQYQYLTKIWEMTPGMTGRQGQKYALRRRKKDYKNNSGFRYEPLHIRCITSPGEKNSE